MNQTGQQKANNNVRLHFKRSGSSKEDITKCEFTETE